MISKKKDKQKKQEKEKTKQIDEKIIPQVFDMHPLPLENVPEEIPGEMERKLWCPMSLQIMTDPVLTSSGHTYERKNIEEYIDEYGIDPMTRKELSKDSLIPNHIIRDLISNYIALPQIPSSIEETKL
eukprot:CAMPEP_0205824118 /NCGR_PEP_ID=MMETSP0206-20130828/19528_1 /ASSEMBLY_ACC=CAM_ASM_000279 /TAXON_ID=36767 /ORGANISM="Euplotes focardii, Strain TN1" /LENGTH=127 /DNA_ID=CAMNT_0053121933 /DNA_START=1 /DNA_END=384 /DNA_ORIENTATION=+